MWCAVETDAVVEKTAETYMKSILPPELYSRCVAPEWEFIVKRHGKLFLSKRAFFMHYVLVKTDNPEEVFKVIQDSKRFPLLKKDDYMTHVSEEEGKVLDLLCEEDDCVELSFVKKTKVEAGRSRAEFISGPITRVSEYVKKVDFTKRKAFLAGSLQMYFLYEGESREDLIEDEEYWKY